LSLFSWLSERFSTCNVNFCLFSKSSGLSVYVALPSITNQSYKWACKTAVFIASLFAFNALMYFLNSCFLFLSLVSFTQFSDLNLSKAISFIVVLFASSYMSLLLFLGFDMSVTQNDANQLFRFCSLKFSEKFARKYSAV
jgi:hypothetical protein